MKRIIFQNEPTTGLFEFKFDSNEWVSVDTLNKVCDYQNLNFYCIHIQFSFTVINGDVFPDFGEIDFPEAVIICLCIVYKKVDYETKND